MTFVDYQAREIHIKLVYFGDPLTAAPDLVNALHDSLEDSAPDITEVRSELLRAGTSVAWFQFKPPDLGAIRQGYEARVLVAALSSGASSVFAAAASELLTGVDGVIFVAHGRADALGVDRHAYDQLAHVLAAQQQDVHTIPFACHVRTPPEDVERASIEQIGEMLERTGDVIATTEDDTELAFDSMFPVLRSVILEVRKG